MRSNKKITRAKQIQPKNADFYRAFEDRHRGSRELIKSRLQVYLPFVEPLKMIDAASIALDLGCGRGEWLELLQDNGIQAKGVDLDEGMLLACHKLNLDVHQGDALDYLRGLEADSLNVVSAFHVVEHIAFETLRELTTEAYRVLKPGGLLILETPNSENLVVGTSTFYLDPTHQKPLPAQLLSFVVEYSGFDRVKTLYLQDSQSLATAQQTSLVNVLGGVSPDYSIVAQKKSTKAISALFDKPFEQSYGLRLDALAARYDQETLSHTKWLQSEWDMAKQRIEELSNNFGKQEMHSQWLQSEYDAVKSDVERLQAHSQCLQSAWDGAKSDIERLQAHTQWLQSEYDSVKSDVERLQAHSQCLQNEWDASKLSNEQLQAHSQWLQQEWDASKLSNEQLQAHCQWLQQEWDAANAKVNELEQERKNLYASSSWRITKPLRLLSLGVSKLFNALLYIPKGIWWVIKWLILTLLLIPKAIWWLFKWPFKLILSGLIRCAIKRPAIKQHFFAWLGKYPKAYAHTLHFAKVRGITIDAIPPISSIQYTQSTESRERPKAVLAENTPELTSLSPQARRIYLDLKETMDSNNKENS